MIVAGSGNKVRLPARHGLGDRLASTSERAPELADTTEDVADFGKFGAGEGARTLDPDLGKVVLYH